MKNFGMIFVLLLMASFSAHALETLEGAKKDIDSFKREANAQIESMSHEISTLKTKAEKKGDTAKEKTLSEFEKNRDQLKEQVSNLQVKGQSNWREAKKKLSDSLNELNEKIQSNLKN